MRNYGTLKFTTPNMNSALVEKWEAFKISSATITHKYFKNTHTHTLYPPDIGTKHQACLAGTQQSNREKSDEIRYIEKASISPIHME